MKHPVPNTQRFVAVDVRHESYWGIIYFAPRPFAALARPLPRVPRRPPRAAPPLPAGPAAPRPAPAIREAGAGVANLGADFEDVGGFSTKDVSVVLKIISYSPTKWDWIITRMLSPHQFHREIYLNLSNGLGGFSGEYAVGNTRLTKLVLLLSSSAK